MPRRSSPAFVEGRSDLLRRHFFLIGAAVLVALLVVAGVVRFATRDGEGGAGGGGAAAAQGGRGGAGPGAGGGRGAGAGGRAPVVAAVAVSAREFSDRVEALGVAKARQSVTVTSDTAEVITSVRFRSGQYVRQGQVLVDLRATEQEANVTRARAALNQAQRVYARWRALQQRGFAPAAQVDEYRAAVEDAQASLAAAQAQRNDRVIRAPFSGVIGLTDTTPGLLVTPGTAIATLDDFSAVYVDFALPERFLATVRTGAALQATSDALPGRTLAGRIQQLNTRVDPQTRAVIARAEFPNGDGTIRPGMLLRVSVLQGQRNAPAVPESAVQLEADVAYVFRITRNPRGTIAQRVDVQVGAREGGFAEIRQGLTVGEQVVAEGTNRVQANQPVRLAGAQGGPVGRGGQGAPGADGGAARPPAGGGASGAPTTGARAAGAPANGAAAAPGGPGR